MPTKGNLPKMPKTLASSIARIPGIDANRQPLAVMKQTHVTGQGDYTPEVLTGHLVGSLSLPQERRLIERKVGPIERLEEESSTTSAATASRNQSTSRRGRQSEEPLDDTSGVEGLGVARFLPSPAVKKVCR